MNINEKQKMLEEFIRKNFMTSNKDDGLADTLHSACRDIITDIMHVHHQSQEPDCQKFTEKDLLSGAWTVFIQEVTEDDAEKFEPVIKIGE
jgi:hypothetical protein